MRHPQRDLIGLILLPPLAVSIVRRIRVARSREAAAIPFSWHDLFKPHVPMEQKSMEHLLIEAGTVFIIAVGLMVCLLLDVVS